MTPLPPQTKGKATAFDVEIGRRIRQQRMFLGLSQDDVAKKLNISFQQLQKYENGFNRISAGRLVEIAKILKVDPAVLLQDRSSSTPHKAARDGANITYTSPEPSPDIADLLFYYNKINDSKIRKQILEFVKTLAAGQ